MAKEIFSPFVESYVSISQLCAGTINDKQCFLKRTFIVLDINSITSIQARTIAAPCNNANANCVFNCDLMNEQKKKVLTTFNSQ